MKQSRRDFLKKIPFAASLPFTIGGISMKSMNENALMKMARASADNDRVLIILQMHGGNDGLNALIPVDAYDLYYNRRPNIAIPAKNQSRGYIPLDSRLPSDAQIGLHPDMLDMKALYDTGRVTFVQGVSYQHNNGSHFRGRDIWFMGGSADEYLQSGWVGRYLEKEVAPKLYPQDFPNADMKDPLAIEMGNDVSLIFHQEGNIPTSIAINDPEAFKELIDDLEGFIDEDVDPRGLPPTYLTGSPYYKELDWILSLEDKSKDYAQILFERYTAGGTSSTTYPETYPLNAPTGSLRNPLSGQLRLIARLLAGGCKTKIFLVKIGGFDTHAEQVESYNPTMGSHAALLYHISSAMKSFQEDLRGRGLEDRVLTVSTSEFGRRVHSNGSFGTDHGTGGPIFIFGKGVQPGVVGKVPDLTKNNVEMQYDYRLVYGNIMRDWMLAGDPQADQKLDEIFPGLMSVGVGGDPSNPFVELPLASQVITGTDEFISDRFALENCFPNPAKEKTTMHFRVNRASHIAIELMDINGKPVRMLVEGDFEPGEHKVETDLTGLSNGTYIYQLKSGFFQSAKKLTIKK
jgi:uncharacterized protein (DUF1501 family)